MRVTPPPRIDDISKISHALEEVEDLLGMSKNKSPPSSMLIQHYQSNPVNQSSLRNKQWGMTSSDNKGSSFNYPRQNLNVQNRT